MLDTFGAVADFFATGFEVTAFGLAGLGEGFGVSVVDGAALATVGFSDFVTALTADFAGAGAGAGLVTGAGSFFGDAVGAFVGSGVVVEPGFLTGHSGISGPEIRGTGAGTGAGAGGVPVFPESWITGAGVLGLLAPGVPLSGLSELGESLVTGIGGGGISRLVSSGSNSGAAGGEAGFSGAGCCAELTLSAAKKNPAVARTIFCRCFRFMSPSDLRKLL